MLQFGYIIGHYKTTNTSGLNTDLKVIHMIGLFPPIGAVTGWADIEENNFNFAFDGA